MTVTDEAAQAASSPPKKKLRMSRHKKKAQRKIDVTAEVAAVHKEQDEIKLHGGKIAEKADTELFQIDAGPMSMEQMVGTVKLSKKERYRNKKTMLDKILSPETNVKPVHQPRSHSNRAVDYQNRSLARQQCGLPPKKLKTAEKTGAYDLWDEKERAETFDCNLPKRVDAKGIGHGTKKYTKEKNQLTTRQQSKKKSKKQHQIELPHEGQSYKPITTAHQALLRGEHKKIIDKQEAEQKIERQLAWDRENVATEKSDMQELQQGLFEENEDGWSTEEEEEMVGQVEAALDDNMPKSQAAKNRYKAEMEKQKAIKAEKLKRHQEAQVYNAKKFLKDAKVEDAAIAKRVEKREEKAANKMPRFKTKYEEPDEELKLTSEIKPTLRELVPEGGILKDRYQSLVRRAIIEPHTKHKAKYMRKFKTKLKVKRSVKRAMGEKIG